MDSKTPIISKRKRWRRKTAALFAFGMFSLGALWTGLLETAVDHLLGDEELSVRVWHEYPERGDRPDVTEDEAGRPVSAVAKIFGPRGELQQVPDSRSIGGLQVLRDALLRAVVIVDMIVGRFTAALPRLAGFGHVDDSVKAVGAVHRNEPSGPPGEEQR